MRTSTARPWPTSSWCTSASPAGRRGNGGHSSGNSIRAPHRRSGNPRGDSTSNTPARPSTTAHQGAAANCQTGASSASQASSANSSSSCAPASHSRLLPIHGNGSNRVPSNASGTTPILTQGTATRLANGPPRLTGKPSASSNGNRPSAIAHCARTSTRQPPGMPRRPLKHQASSATAANDSQKPGCRLASGSHSSTRVNATSSGDQMPRWRNRQRHSRTTASIAQARCTGTSKPASRP
ncbi:hypothetical protein D3C81_1460480 [compost metagenome]